MKLLGHYKVLVDIVQTSLHRNDGFLSEDPLPCMDTKESLHFLDPDIDTKLAFLELLHGLEGKLALFGSEYVRPGRHYTHANVYQCFAKSCV